MQEDLISVEGALQRVEQNVGALTPEVFKIKDAGGLILAEDVKSKINMPPFRQSAMDGYAVRYEDKKLERLKLTEEIPAGRDASSISLNVGHAVRIFTGAMVPDSADTVVRQEDVAVEGANVVVNTWPKLGSNIRPEAEQTSKGDIVAQSGDVLNPARLSYLAGLGLTNLRCYPRPKIAVIITGSELRKNGEELNPGSIYESNSFAIVECLKTIDIQNVKVVYLKDELMNSIEVFKTTLLEYDCLIFSGGISVGDHDYVAQILDDESVEKVFYKVKQKPGKPLYFGKRSSQYIFALPGNPAAALTCMYVYVIPAIKILMGAKEFGAHTKKLKLREDFELKGGRSQFLKAKQDGELVDVLDFQSSAMLKSFAESDCLVYLSGQKSIYKAGESVTCYTI